VSFADGQKRRDSALVDRFGQPVRYDPIDGTPSEFKAIFQNPTRQTETGPRTVPARFALLTVLKTDVPTPQKNDQVTIDGVEYRVHLPLPDEGELIPLQLEELG
jgi:hypothetical protein